MSASSSGAENNNDEWNNNPVVSWPAFLANLVDQMQPASSTLVMPMPQTMTFKAKDASEFRDFDSESQSYCGGYHSYCGQDLTTTEKATTTISTRPSSLSSSTSHLYG